jgi:hypothetical protein
MIADLRTQALYHLADREHDGPEPCGPDCALQPLSVEERKEVHDYVEWVKALEGPERWPRLQNIIRLRLACQG